MLQVRGRQVLIHHSSAHSARDLFLIHTATRILIRTLNTRLVAAEAGRGTRQQPKQAKA